VPAQRRSLAFGNAHFRNPALTRGVIVRAVTGFARLWLAMIRKFPGRPPLCIRRLLGW
jgi:hypothetical protein